MDTSFPISLLQVGAGAGAGLCVLPYEGCLLKGIFADSVIVLIKGVKLLLALSIVLTFSSINEVYKFHFDSSIFHLYRFQQIFTPL